MSDSAAIPGSQLIDKVGLHIQELHAAGHLRGEQPLLRIDNREEARRAPFQFDAATGRLHRTGCRAIPQGSLSALYGVWQIGQGEKPLVCPRCKPMPKTDDRMNDTEFPMDMLYGLLAVISQFGGVLRERGQEYRNSQPGQVLGQQIDKMYRGVNDREKAVLDVLLTSLDGLARTIHDLDESLNEMSGGANGHGTNGHGPNGSAGAGNGKQAPSSGSDERP